MVDAWNLSWLSLFIICSQLCRAVTQNLKLEPKNSTVLQGSDVRFNATVQGNWEIMTWTVGELLVLTVFAPSAIIPSSDQYSARICSSGVTGCVEFTVHNVTRRLAGSVTCSVQGDDKPQTAQLYVQESGTVHITGGNVTVIQNQQVEFQCVTTAWFPTPSVSWSQNGQAVDSSLYNTSSTADGDFFNSTSVLKIQAVSNTKVECMAILPALKTPQSSFVFMMIAPKPPDWTVLIAIVVSFGGCALLVLLIIGIIFCYRRRKEQKSTHQGEMSGVKTQSQISASEQRKGQGNPSYELDDQTRVTPNVFLSVHNNLKGLGMGTKNQVEHMDSNCEGVVKHRHVTIV